MQDQLLQHTGCWTLQEPLVDHPPETTPTVTTSVVLGMRGRVKIDTRELELELRTRHDTQIELPSHLPSFGDSPSVGTTTCRRRLRVAQAPGIFSAVGRDFQLSVFGFDGPGGTLVGKGQGGTDNAQKRPESGRKFSDRAFVMFCVVFHVLCRHWGR